MAVSVVYMTLKKNKCKILNRALWNESSIKSDKGVTLINKVCNNLIGKNFLVHNSFGALWGGLNI